MNALTNVLDAVEELEDNYPLAFNAAWITLAVMSIVTWPLQPIALVLFIALVSIGLTNLIRFRKQRYAEFKERVKFDADDATKGLKLGVVIGAASTILLVWVTVSIIVGSPEMIWQVIPLTILTLQGLYTTGAIIQMHRYATSIKKGNN